MAWVVVFIALDLLVVFLLLRRSDPVPTNVVAAHLRNGALLIDVRTPQEFAASHLPNAVNIPLTGIHSLVPMRIKDRSRVLLLHGQTGMRSDIAKRMLVKLGYTNTLNLGSFERASQIAAAR